MKWSKSIAVNSIRCAIDWLICMCDTFDGLSNMLHTALESIKCYAMPHRLYVFRLKCVAFVLILFNLRVLCAVIASLKLTKTSLSSNTSIFSMFCQLKIGICFAVVDVYDVSCTQF